MAYYKCVVLGVFGLMLSVTLAQHDHDQDHEHDHDTTLESCDDVTVQTDFNTTAYLGTWHEYARVNSYYQQNGRCVKAVYTDVGNGVVGVENTHINTETNTSESIYGTVTVNSDTGDAKLELVFPSVPVSAPYWVLGTDYETYAVVWSCTDVTEEGGSTAWILTRDRNPSEETIEAAYEVLDSNNISHDLLSVTDQEGCTN